jgi:DNA (cytosine-5)-methyltransferase 1
VEFFKPKAFVMENVPNLISMSNGTIKDAILSDFEKMGYKTTYKVLLGSAYGLPQNRRRVVFVGLLNGREFEFPEPTHGENLAPLVTCEEAIGDLPSDSVAEGGNYPHAAQTEYQKMMRKNSSGVFNHEITNHAEETKRIIAMVPDGGNFRSLPKKLQSTRKVNIAWTRFNSKKPSYTIDTGHFHHFHYKYNRVPTARESARLQSFPDDFIFIGNKTSKLKQVGNAVPPLLGNLLAERLLRYM